MEDIFTSSYKNIKFTAIYEPSFVELAIFQDLIINRFKKHQNVKSVYWNSRQCVIESNLNKLLRINISLVKYYNHETECVENRFETTIYKSDMSQVLRNNTVKVYGRSKFTSIKKCIKEIERFLELHNI
jgi:hypothetical protein